jgi:predicted nucleic acid-binding protein
VPRPAYLIDTDWIIDHLCGIAPVTQKLRALEPEGLAISIISLAELYEGVHYSRDPHRSMAALQQFVTGVVVCSPSMNRSASCLERSAVASGSSAAPSAIATCSSRAQPSATASRSAQITVVILKWLKVSRSFRYKGNPPFYSPPDWRVEL